MVADGEVSELIHNFPRSPAAGVEAEAVLREGRAETADPQQLVVGVVDQLRRQVDAGDGRLTTPLGGEDRLKGC